MKLKHLAYNVNKGYNNFGRVIVKTEFDIYLYKYFFESTRISMMR